MPDSKDKDVLKKKKYKKPQLKKEKVMAFGAGCNGVQGNGKKAAAGPPDFCISAKLLS